MKLAVSIVRIIVAVLFIISGLVKANDPLGLSYKMQEFFEIWNASLGASFLSQIFSYFHDHSLALSVVMIGLEIIAGVALLIGWQKRFIISLLLLLIIFFTFLTAYAYWSGKFKNCGCFGDCLPITPLTSFLKDVVLLLLILFLFFNQRYIQPVFSSKKQFAVMAFSLLFTIGLQWYVLNYLPLVDCLPFKEGNNIAEQMKIPPNAIRDSFAMKFIYEKQGKRYEFGMEELPSDLASYKFIDRTERLIRKGNAEPPIKGFSLTGSSGADSTSEVLNGPRVILLFAEQFRKPITSWVGSFRDIYTKAKAKGTPVYIVTADAANAKTTLRENGLAEVPVFSCDNTAVKTAARTNPTVFLLQQGTIRDKYSYKRIVKLSNKL